jgi:hypothetical protein
MLVSALGLLRKGSIGSVVYLLIAETGQFCDERIDQPAPRREEGVDAEGRAHTTDCGRSGSSGV